MQENRQARAPRQNDTSVRGCSATEGDRSKVSSGETLRSPTYACAPRAWPSTLRTMSAEHPKVHKLEVGGVLGMSGVVSSLTVLPQHARRWYEDAVAEVSSTSDNRDSRRREIVFAVSGADSYLFEWVRDNIGEWQRLHGPTEFGTWGMFFLLFPERDMRAINQRWTEVAKDLHQYGYIPLRPDFGGPHGEEWKTLLAWRSGLIHGKVSRPDAANLEPEQLAVPARDELRECKPGWAVQIATERIRRLHVAAGTDPPDWLVNV